MSLPFDDLPPGDLPRDHPPQGNPAQGNPAQDNPTQENLTQENLTQRVLLLLLLLARDAELAVDQVDGPRARTLVRRGLTGGARISLPCSPRRQASAGARPWMCQTRAVA